MKALIITGGTSSERRISFMSAKQVKKGLEEVGHKVKLFDLKKGYQQLKKEALDFDVIFPVIHGEEGEGGSLQKFLSSLKVPFVGGDPKGFKKGWYKIPFKKFCEANNILTSPWKRVKHKGDLIRFGFPSVLKSSSGGSSLEVVILKSEADLKNRLLYKLLKSNQPLFVEKYLPGTEITVAILQNRALPVVEIIPTTGWFDYHSKYSPETKEIPFAPSVAPNIQRLTQKIALKIHQTLKLGPYSRIDFIVSDGKPYVLEVNTIPGLTASSLFPKAAQAAGISFPKLLDKMIRVALGNDPILAKVAKAIPKSQINSAETGKIVESMLKVAHGQQKNKKKPMMVGLAAPQIGILKRIILVDVKANGRGKVGKLRVYINPEIIWKSKREGEWYEGCFSTGKVCGIVKRPVSVKIEGFNLDGKLVKEKYSGYAARIFQHEIDHLNGKRFPDLIKDPDKLHWVLKKEFPLYRDQGAWKTWPKKCSFEKWKKIKGQTPS